MKHMLKQVSYSETGRKRPPEKRPAYASTEIDVNKQIPIHNQLPSI